MGFSFVQPAFLWLLLLLPFLWAVTWLAPRRLARWRWWASLLLRTLAILGVILALAGTQLVRRTNDVTTVFLLDASDSVALSQRARAEGFVQQALAARKGEDRAGLVVFGAQALVERPPGTEATLGQIATQPGGASTNIEDAVQLGLAMLPNEGYRRLVLLSDGGENSGDAAAAARLAATRGVPVDVVALSGLADGTDAQIGGIELPANVREGQRVRMRIAVESNVAGTARLVIEGSNRAVLADQQVQVQGGVQQFEVDVLPQRGFNRYVARLEFPGDARTENNVSEAYTLVEGRPRVLLVENEASAGENLQAALTAANVEVATAAPETMPTSLGAMADYEAIVLLGVPRANVPERAQAALSAYVHDLGRSLMMVGGDRSFGAGGWRETPVETALPVTMDIPTRIAQLPAAVVILIDVSGSMAAEENGKSKVSLAAEGAQQVAALLRDEDELSVIPFDSGPVNPIGPIAGRDRDKAIAALARIKAGGGGITIHDGLVEAETYIDASTKPIRHIITITDGNDTVQQEGALDIVRRLRDKKVTITSIAVGDGSDVPYLRQQADLGGGRFFLTDKASALPTLLVDETQAVVQPYVIEEPFTPGLVSSHQIVRDLTAFPSLGGYVVTTPKQTAQVLLATPRGDPVLAVWQYGLGRSLAWTSDMRGQWGNELVSWDGFPRFSAQLVSWLLPARQGQSLSLDATTSGDLLVLEANATDPQGRAMAGLKLQARLLTGAGNEQRIDLREVGPGQYRAALDGVAPGAYLAQVLASDATGQPVDALVAGVVVPRSAEYRSQGANPALLDDMARTTGGRINPAAADTFLPNANSAGAVGEIGRWLLWLALLLLPLDVAIRRLTLRRDGLAALRPTAIPRPAMPKLTATPKAPKPPRSASAAQDLTELRAAQERARKRARGEE